MNCLHRILFRFRATHNWLINKIKGSPDGGGGVGGGDDDETCTSATNCGGGFFAFYADVTATSRGERVGIGKISFCNFQYNLLKWIYSKSWIPIKSTLIVLPDDQRGARGQRWTTNSVLFGASNSSTSCRTSTDEFWQKKRRETADEEKLTNERRIFACLLIREIKTPNGKTI